MMTSSMEFPGSLNKWYISGIDCQLGDYISPTTYEGNQKQLSTSAMTVKEASSKNLDFCIQTRSCVESSFSKRESNLSWRKKHLIFHFKPGTF